MINMLQLLVDSHNKSRATNVNPIIWAAAFKHMKERMEDKLYEMETD